MDGIVIGNHDGLHRYTVGQRKGLTITVKEYENYFVIGFDGKQNSLIVGPEKYLLNSQLLATEINWLKTVDPIRGLRCKAKIRSRHEDASCAVTHFENATVHVQFDEPQRAITPGQAIVFYSEEEEVLGGGFIDSFVQKEYEYS